MRRSPESGETWSVAVLVALVLLAMVLTPPAAAVVPCDQDADQVIWGPAGHACPTIGWDVMAERVDGFRIYYWDADSIRGDTWRYVSCWLYPDDPDFEELAGTRFCHGEILPRPLIREISFPPGTSINLCVTAMRLDVDELGAETWLESTNCSNVVNVCWPTVTEYE